MHYVGLRDRIHEAPGEWVMKKCSSTICKTLWLDPAPAPDDVADAYKTYFTHAGARKKHRHFARLLEKARAAYLATRFGYDKEHLGAFERLLAVLVLLYPGRAVELDFSVMWLDSNRRGKVLDVGCGSGWLVANLQKLGWNAVGVDFDPVAIAAGKDAGLDLRLGALVDQGIPKESFDAVTMSHFIEHVHEPLEALRECHRILRPGGTLAIATPNAKSVVHSLAGSNWLHLDPPRHLQIFSLQSLTHLATSAGFLVEKSFTTVRDANNVWIASLEIAFRNKTSLTGRTIFGKLAGRFLQCGSALCNRVTKGSGEDLVLICRR